ncbi:MAG: Hpt domain-containing protein [Treponema sp.]|jgi:HPt (histidine-containing phosphotransfer) domain-containing protein|nr:Hpt domain-containing protein [Treponema sp.]
MDRNIPINIEGLDTQQGMAMTGGTPEAYGTVLEVYCRDVEDRLKTLAAFEDGGCPPEDLPGFVSQVHALKSASASIGAAALSVTAAELEAAGRRGDRECIQRALGAFRRSLDSTAARINAALQSRAALRSQALRSQAAQDRDLPQDSGPGGEQARELLLGLKAALEAENIENIDRFISDLEALPLSGPLRKACDDISGNVLICEFPAAIAVIDKLPPFHSKITGMESETDKA